MQTETLTKMHRAYVECALWSSTDDEGESLDHCSSLLSDEAEVQMKQDCESFLEYAEEVNGPGVFIGWNDEQLGHDFWLTRNGHGAGFWDRYYNDSVEASNGRKLTEAAKTFGSSDLYIGDDGLIYVS